MLHTKFRKNILKKLGTSLPVLEKKMFEWFLLYMGMAAILVM